MRSALEFPGLFDSLSVHWAMSVSTSPPDMWRRVLEEGEAGTRPGGGGSIDNVCPSICRQMQSEKGKREKKKLINF